MTQATRQVFFSANGSGVPPIPAPSLTLLFVLALFYVLPVICFAADYTVWLHLPGIGGHLPIDDLVTGGIHAGGIGAEAKIEDWTVGRTGLAALTNYNANIVSAQKIADEIAALAHADPKAKILITSHSAGTGIAIFALERLPDDVHIDTLVMIASALSPKYDLSKALRHVDGKVFALISPLDPVVGVLTQKFGTIDRVYSYSGGNVGFAMPPGGDVDQYRKLVSVPYNPAWLEFGNAGEHIGAMNWEFGEHVIAPMLKLGRVPTTQESEGR